MVHSCNSSTWATEAGEYLVIGKPELKTPFHREVEKSGKAVSMEE